MPKAEPATVDKSPMLEEKRILFAYSAFKSQLNFVPTHSSMEPFRRQVDGFTTGKETMRSLMTDRSRRR